MLLEKVHTTIMDTEILSFNDFNEIFQDINSNYVSIEENCGKILEEYIAEDENYLPPDENDIEELPEDSVSPEEPVGPVEVVKTENNDGEQENVTEEEIFNYFKENFPLLDEVCLKTEENTPPPPVNAEKPVETSVVPEVIVKDEAAAILDDDDLEVANSYILEAGKQENFHPLDNNNIETIKDTVQNLQSTLTKTQKLYSQLVKTKAKSTLKSEVKNVVQLKLNQNSLVLLQNPNSGDYFVQLQPQIQLPQSQIISTPLLTSLPIQKDLKLNQLKRLDSNLKSVPQRMIKYPQIDNKIYKDSEKQKLHKTKHPFKCTDCEFRASTLKNLISHFSMHKDVFKYSCKLCGYKTHAKSRITRHEKTHTNEKPYRCTHCTFSTREKRNLDKHIDRFHSIDIYLAKKANG